MEQSTEVRFILSIILIEWNSRISFYIIETQNKIKNSAFILNLHGILAYGIDFQSFNGFLITI